MGLLHVLAVVPVYARAPSGRQSIVSLRGLSFPHALRRLAPNGDAYAPARSVACWSPGKMRTAAEADDCTCWTVEGLANGMTSSFWDGTRSFSRSLTGTSQVTPCSTTWVGAPFRARSHSVSVACL